MSCNVSIKLHYLKSYADKFPQNLGSVSEEQEEQFHQDIKTMRERQKGLMGQPYNGRLLLEFQKRCPRSFQQKNVFKEKVSWSAICTEHISKTRLHQKNYV